MPSRSRMVKSYSVCVSRRRGVGGRGPRGLPSEPSTWPPGPSGGGASPATVELSILPVQEAARKMVPRIKAERCLATMRFMPTSSEAHVDVVDVERLAPHESPVEGEARDGVSFLEAVRTGWPIGIRAEVPEWDADVRPGLFD